MPIARIVTPITVPQTLTRPGLMVVEPRNAPTSAGSRYSRPTLAWPMRSFEARMHAGERGDHPRSDKGDDRVSPNRHAVEFGRLWIRAYRVEIAADRKILEHKPETDRQREHVVAGDRQAEKQGAVQCVEGVRQHADDLTAAGMPESRSRRGRSGAERRDERVDLRDLDQYAIERPTPAPSANTLSTATGQGKPYRVCRLIARIATARCRSRR